MNSQTECKQCGRVDDCTWFGFDICRVVGTEATEGLWERTFYSSYEKIDRGGANICGNCQRKNECRSILPRVIFGLIPIALQIGLFVYFRYADLPFSFEGNNLYGIYLILFLVIVFVSIAVLKGTFSDLMICNHHVAQDLCVEEISGRYKGREVHTGDTLPTIGEIVLIENSTTRP